MIFTATSCCPSLYKHEEPLSIWIMIKTSAINGYFVAYIFTWSLSLSNSIIILGFYPSLVWFHDDLYCYQHSESGPCCSLWLLGRCWSGMTTSASLVLISCFVARDD